MNKQATGAKLTPAGQRVVHLLDELWNGNQSAMARDLGLSTTAVHKVLHGQQEPGRRFLTALAKQPRVNPAWVFTGEGEPLLGFPTLSSEGGTPLPVLDRLLPGSPEGYASQIVGREHWVASALWRPSRYLLRVSSDFPVMGDPEAKVAVGDLLLIETEPFWRDEPAALHNKLVSVDLSPSGTLDMQLGRAILQRDAAGFPQLLVDIYGRCQCCIELPRTQHAQLDVVRSYHFEGKPSDAESESVPVLELPLDAIRGVVLLLLRQ
ncbi:MAG: helix-turn-helix transcriptional regulator [Planctomycetaceae bacterium]|jgi:hypothetical protein|nr:helix-turn-helix transcriptional regulator [Planctomycetaceae bacterium]MBT6485497.1 helix-turn-helix transcriptional regulator [Planctomycetaceae bacterium]